MKRLILLSVAILLTTGCSSIPNATGKEINRSWKTPFFSDTVSSDAVAKVTNEEGTVTRRAINYKHDTTVLGWGRTLTAKEIEFEIKPKK